MVISYFLNSLGSWVCPAEYDVLVYAGQRTSMQEQRNNRDIIRIKYRRNLEFAGLYDIAILNLLVKAGIDTIYILNRFVA